MHADPRGSIVAVTDYLGNSIATNTYDEYGIPDSASGNDISTKGRFRYTGQAWIPELEMYYYKARIYSPTLGRFMQTDPIGYEDQFNLYAYVGNDPINGVDFTGLQEQCGTNFDSEVAEVESFCEGTPTNDSDGGSQEEQADTTEGESPQVPEEDTSEDEEDKSIGLSIVSSITDGETAMTRQMAQDDRAVLAGEMTPEEYRERAQARAAGVATGAAAHLIVRVAPAVARGAARGANKNPVLRIGPGWKGSQTAGHRVFRIVIGRKKPYTIFGRRVKIHKHLDLWPW